MSCGVYKIENLVNGKIYVGSSCKISFRWKRHLYHLRHNIHNNKKLQRSYNKHGEDSFLFEILELCTPEELFIREQAWIDTLHPYYNISKVAGSILGYKHSEETKDRIRTYWVGRFKNMTDEERKEWGNRSRGIVQSEEVRRVKSERWIKEKYWEKTLEVRTKSIREKKAKKIMQFDLDNNFLNEFDAVRDAAKAIGMNYRNCSELSKACSGKRKTAQGFIWKYKNN